MNKVIKEVFIQYGKEFNIDIQFNGYRYSIDEYDLKDLSIEKNEDKMLECFPGIYLSKKCIAKHIPFKIMIYVCNFRDNITIYKNGVKIYDYLGSRKMRVQPSNVKFDEKNIALKSIHFPENETGGDGERCILKKIFKELKIYPSLNRIGNSDSYLLFDYEEIFQLPCYVPELKEKCWLFCSRRNREHKKYSLLDNEDIYIIVDRLINEHISGAVQLSVNSDFTYSIENGNHRICFLKHFSDELGIDSVFVKNIDYSHMTEKQNINQFNGYSYKSLNTDSYYNQLADLGVSKDEARYILLEGMNSADLFKYLLKKEFIKI